MSVKEKTLNLLKEKRRVTKLDIANETGSSNGGEYIRRLRAEGHKIQTMMEKNKNTGTSYGVYVYG